MFCPIKPIKLVYNRDVALNALSNTSKQSTNDADAILIRKDYLNTNCEVFSITQNNSTCQNVVGILLVLLKQGILNHQSTMYSGWTNLNRYVLTVNRPFLTPKLLRKLVFFLWNAPKRRVRGDRLVLKIFKYEGRSCDNFS